jgi:outer membrane protein assembly factor BamB
LPAALACFLGSAIATAGDWPQILGPSRNGVAVGETLAAAWPRGGPPTLWQREVGRGFAGVAVSQKVVLLFHRVGDAELVEALRASNAATLWKASFPARYVPSYTEDDGPRTVPLVGRGRVYVQGAAGQLRCLDLQSGKVLWERDTFADFNSQKPFHGEPPEGYFGIASSPLLEGDKLLVNVGGDARQAGIVAFAADTGRTVWQATSERASYSSPVAVTVGGVRHAIFVTRLSVVSLNPDDGKVRFQFPFGRTGPTVNAANPVVFDGRLLVTASYGIGSVLARIGADRAELLWRDREILASQYTTCVESGGLLWGIHGRQDGPPAELRCFDPQTRRVLYSQPEFGYATLIKAGDKLLILKTDGRLVLAAARPDKYEELAQSQICDNTVRALPALAEGLLYVRDTQVLKCIDLRPRRP